MFILTYWLYHSKYNIKNIIEPLSYKLDTSCNINEPALHTAKSNQVQPLVGLWGKNWEEGRSTYTEPNFYLLCFWTAGRNRWDREGLVILEKRENSTLDAMM